MTWVRVDTRFPTHHKTLDVGPLAEALWLRGLCYAGEHLTDGFIPVALVRRMGDLDGPAEAERLAEAGLWDEAEGGWRIHDYLDWQRSKAESDDISAKRAEAGRRGGKQRSSNLLQANEANPKQAASKTQADKKREEERRTDDAPLPPNPNGRADLQPVPKPSQSQQPPPRRINDEGEYERQLAGALPRFATHVTGLHRQLTEGWLRNTLREAEDHVGPLPRDKLVRGLDLAFEQFDLKRRAGKVESPRGFAARLVVSYLREQADDAIERRPNSATGHD